MLAIFLLPCALTGKTTASCLLSLFLISELFPKQDTAHQPFGIFPISVVRSSSMQFVLTVKYTEAKSKELVIWAPTVVMKHRQFNRPNQIFGCASSDAYLILSLLYWQGRGALTGGEAPKGEGDGDKKHPHCVCHPSAQSPAPFSSETQSKPAA